MEGFVKVVFLSFEKLFRHKRVRIMCQHSIQQDLCLANPCESAHVDIARDRRCDGITSSCDLIILLVYVLR